MSDKKNTELNKASEKEKLSKTEQVKDAFEQAEKDIEKDPDFRPDEDEDLDEGELARKEGHP
jgi:hypothetical protein